MNGLLRSSQVENLEELIGILEKQEEMVSLMEDLQILNDSLEQELTQTRQLLSEKEEELDELMRLADSLNSENERLNSQIREFMSLRE